MNITTLPQALACIDDLKEQLSNLRQQLGHSASVRDYERLGRRWRLTGREAQVLLLLHHRKGSMISKDGFLDAMYGDSPDPPQQKLIDVFICKVRNKVGEDFIETVWGQGYRLTADGLAQVNAVLAADAGDIERADVGPRPSAAKSMRQAQCLAMLVLHGPLDINGIHDHLPEEDRVSTHRIRNALAGARRSKRLRVNDWRAGKDGLRRAIYEITPAGVAYVRVHAPSMLDIPA